MLRVPGKSKKNCTESSLGSHEEVLGAPKQNAVFKKVTRFRNRLSRLSGLTSNFVHGINAQRWVFHIETEKDTGFNYGPIASLKGAGAGKKCLIVGTAPSTREVNLGLAYGCHVMALNRAEEISDILGRPADSLVMSDPSAMSEYGKTSAKFAKTAFLDQSAALRSGLEPQNAVFFRQYQFPRMDDGFFQFDLNKPIYQSRTVAHSALQIAVWMGFEEIGFVGVDFSFDGKDPHFYKTFGAELKRSNIISMSKSSMMIEGLVKARKILKAEGIEVINAGDPEGNNPFEYVELEKFCRDR